MKSCFAFFLIVAAAFGLIRLIIYLLRFIKNDLAQNRVEMFDSLRRGENVFAQFKYSYEEWKTVLEKEFLEDRRGIAKLFGAHNAIARYEDEAAVETAGEVFFTADKIYLTDSVNHKIYTVNTRDYAIALLEAGLLNTAPLKTLRLRVHIDQPDTFPIEDYFHVPLPAAAEAKIPQLLNFYQSTIEERGRIERGE